MLKTPRSSPARIMMFPLAAAAMLWPCQAPAADADALTGIHWWGLKPGTSSYSQGIDPVPAEMLDSIQRGAWDVEIVNTHGPAWQNAQFHVPLYEDLYNNKNVSLVTRVEYEYGTTVPSPQTINTSTWAGNVVGIVNTLKDWAHIWQLGNEPNLHGEGNGWTNNQVTPAGYADIYATVRQRIGSDAQVGPPGAHQLLVAPVSPGGVIPGVRWMDGNQWLGETIDAIHAAGSSIDGFALHSYGGGPTTTDAIRDFHRAIAEQVAVIDSKGLVNTPLYITEWNRFAQPNAPDAAAQEALQADFARAGLRMLDRWNRTPGNHNIVSTAWFVYESGSTDGTAAWDGYSIEYWMNNGNPQGHPGDLFTAFAETARQGYRAGIAGTRPLPDGVRVIDDFESGDGHFTWTPTQSPTSAGARSDSFKVRTADDSYTKSYAHKLGIFDDPANPNGWYIRHVSGGGSPANNDPITLSSAADGNIGLFLRVLTNSAPELPLSVQLILDSGPTGGGADSDAGVPRSILADGEWHFYEWNLDSAADWTAWRDANGNIINGSDGIIASSGQVTIDSIILRGGNADVEFFLDSVMHNANGSLSAMLPIPEPTLAAPLALFATLCLHHRRRRNRD